MISQPCPTVKVDLPDLAYSVEHCCKVLHADKQCLKGVYLYKAFVQ